MRILFVSALVNPLDKPINGDAQRTQLLLKACAAIANVDLVSFAGKVKEDVLALDNVRVVFDERVPVPQLPISRWKKWSFLLPWADVHSLFPINHRWESTLDHIIQTGDYDLIVTRYFPRAVACGLLKYQERLVVDFDDAPAFFFLNQLSAASAMTTRVRLRLAAWKAKSIAHRTVRSIYASFFAEETTARANFGTFLPNVPYYMGGCNDADMSVPIKRIVFVGQLEYQPNKEGLDFFLNHVYLPLIKRISNVEMHIVGYLRDDALRKRWEMYPGVTVTGFVDDLIQEYNLGHVVVVPIYRCGATNIKLLEAMSMNRACVTTKVALEKLNGRFESGKELYAASNDDEFVEMLIRLLTDETENHCVAHNAKTVMEDYYSLDAFCKIVKNAIVK